MLLDSNSLTVRQHHSTETAVTRVYLLLVVDDVELVDKYSPSYLFDYRSALRYTGSSLNPPHIAVTNAKCVSDYIQNLLSGSPLYLLPVVYLTWRGLLWDLTCLNSYFR